MIETEEQMMTAALSWADDAIARHGPGAEATAWQRFCWRRLRKATRMMVAAGYIGGYGAAQRDAEGPAHDLPAPPW